jgi:hypothetical protein
MKLPDLKNILIDNSAANDSEFKKQNLIYIASAGILMVAGPLFMYYGFYLLTWPYTVKWGALSIAIGVFVLAFGFSLWQDRQILVLERTYLKDAAEIKQLIRELRDERK